MEARGIAVCPIVSVTHPKRKIIPMIDFDFQTTTTLVVFASVILLIAFDVMDMMLVGLLGVSALTVTGVITAEDVSAVNRTAGGPITLLFGGMVVARVLAPTGIFERVGTLALSACYQRKRQAVSAGAGNTCCATLRGAAQCYNGDSACPDNHPGRNHP